MLRLFVGIEFPPELKLRLSLLQSGIAGARWIDPGNFHLTLRFIGEIDEGTAADVDEALLPLKSRPFSVQLGGVGVFGGDKLRTLWVGVEREPALLTLQGKIELALIRAEPLRVDRFSLIASYPTKAGSVYEDQADYPLHP
jgi:2'-5' RNA ligase